MTAWWYWLLFALAAAALLVGVPLAARCERRREQRLREMWDRMYGAGTQPRRTYEEEWARTAAGQMEALQEAIREFGRAFRDALTR